jgi:uncharacterized membrane protein YGL010W
MANGFSWKALSADYATYHTDPRNRLCHMAGIPLIVFCVVRWTTLAGGWPPAAVVVLPLYLFWDLALGVAMSVIILAMWPAARALPAWPFFVFFVVGWYLQFLGHKYEGKSPAFLRNLVHLLVGPLWILREAAVAIFLR